MFYTVQNVHVSILSKEAMTSEIGVQTPEWGFMDGSCAKIH